MFYLHLQPATNGSRVFSGWPSTNEYPNYASIAQLIAFILRHFHSTTQRQRCLFLPPSPFNQRLVSQGEER